MQSPRFYVSHPLTTSLSLSEKISEVRDNVITLDGSVARHMTQVLRLKVGSTVILFNGKGGEYKATIRAIAKQSVTLKLEEFVNRECESSLKISLAQGVSRGERMDYTLQKATELGVTHITPIRAERTVVNLKGDRQAKRINHWQKIVNSACEQCGRNMVPSVAPVEEFEVWARRQLEDTLVGKPNSRIKILLHHEAQQGLFSLATSLRDQDLPIILLIGPEGGISKKEYDLAIQAGFKSMHLGPRILRTETAAVVALSILQSTLGDL